MNDPTDKQIAEAVERITPHIPVGHLVVDVADLRVVLAALAAREVPEDVAALVARVKDRPTITRLSHKTQIETIEALRDALEVSSRPVAHPTPEHVLTGETSDDHPYKGKCSCGEWVYNHPAHVARNSQPAPVIDHDALAQALTAAGYEDANHNWRALDIVDALLASGWQPASPRTVTTVEELDALPTESVVRIEKVRFGASRVYRKINSESWVCDMFVGYSGPVPLPATVLYVPSEGEES